MHLSKKIDVFKFEKKDIKKQNLNKNHKIELVC